MNKEMKKGKSKHSRDVSRKGCPLRNIPRAVRVQTQNFDNLLDRICSGLVWNG